MMSFLLMKTPILLLKTNVKCFAQISGGYTPLIRPNIDSLDFA